MEREDFYYCLSQSMRAVAFSSIPNEQAQSIQDFVGSMYIIS